MSILGTNKSIVDELVGIGCPVKHVEYVDAILEGFLHEYAPIICH